MGSEIEILRARKRVSDFVLKHENPKLYDEDLGRGNDFAIAAEVAVLFAALAVPAEHVVV